MGDPNEPCKVTIWLPRYAKESLREEAFKRKMAQGVIVLEALTRRVMFYERKEEGETK